MSNQLENILSKIIKYGLYAILLTPLAFWPKALYPFLTPKFILFQILVEIVFAAWIILLMIDSKNQSYLRKNYIATTLMLFFAVSLISAIFGIDFQRSFWGIGARMTGLFAELHFLAWFLVLISISKSGFRSPTSRTPEVGLQMLKSDFDMTRYLNFSFFVSLIVAATAFYQNPQWGLSFGYTIFNNPTFVAPYLIFHFFWGVYQFLIPKSDFSRSPTSRSPEVGLQMPKSDFGKNLFFGGGAAFLLLVILFTQIRGAIIGLLAGIFIIGFGLIFANILGRRFRITLSIFYFIFSIILVGLWFLRGNEAIQKFSPIKRVTGISLGETTVQTRILAWQAAIKGFPDRPFFGTGPENFNYLFNANYDPRFLKFGGGGFGETWFDKPHNAFLEILTETGIIGGLAYILIWIAVVMALFKLFKSGQKLLTIILSGAFVAYFGTVFFSFDSFGSWFGLYLIFSFLAFQNYTPSDNIDVRHQYFPDVGHQYYLLKNALIIFILICVFILGYLNYSIWRANLLDAGALRTFYRDPSAGLVLFDKSFSHFSPYKDEYQLDMISSVAGAVQKNVKLPNWEEAINYMLEKADEVVRAHPKNAAYYTDLVKIYNILGVFGRDPEILAQAELFGEKSLELSPGRQETLFYLTQTALLEGNNDTAVKLAQQAVDADPTIGLSHWYFGLAYIANGQIQEGTNEIKKALNLGYMPQNDKEKNIIKNLGL